MQVHGAAKLKKQAHCISRSTTRKQVYPKGYLQHYLIHVNLQNPQKLQGRRLSTLASTAHNLPRCANHVTFRQYGASLCVPVNFF